MLAAHPIQQPVRKPTKKTLPNRTSYNPTRFRKLKDCRNRALGFGQEGGAVPWTLGVAVTGRLIQFDLGQVVKGGNHLLETRACLAKHLSRLVTRLPGGLPGLIPTLCFLGPQTQILVV